MQQFNVRVKIVFVDKKKFEQRKISLKKLVVVQNENDFQSRNWNIFFLFGWFDWTKNIQNAHVLFSILRSSTFVTMAGNYGANDVLSISYTVISDTVKRKRNCGGSISTWNHYSKIQKSTVSWLRPLHYSFYCLSVSLFFPLTLSLKHYFPRALFKYGIGRLFIALTYAPILSDMHIT